MTGRLEEFFEKSEKITLGGGQDKIEKHHKSGKLTARERIDALCDEGSFEEFDRFVKHRATSFGLENKEFPADGVITGIGTVNGRKIAVFSQDFTVQGGSLGEMHAKKIMKVQDMAMKLGIPIVGINDSGGARIQEGVDSLFGYGGIFHRNTLSSGVIPQITVICGPCAGGAVYSPAITDFIVMTDKHSQMFITGPQVIKAVTGEETSMEELGGALVHNTKSGNAHFLVPDDKNAMLLVRELLEYLPQNNSEEPLKTESTVSDPVLELREIVPDNPKQSYDIKKVISLVVDDGKFLEVHEHYAKNMVIGFARIGGRSVGIVANQPSVFAGSLDINASDKAARFIRFLDAFNLPIITFVDTPGFLPGISQEHGGIIRHGAKLLYSYSEASVQKITLILRKAYGGAYIAMGSQHLGADIVFAWPGAEIAVMGPEGAANIIFKREIDASGNPEKTRQEKIAEYKDVFANPFVAAGRGYIESIIDPAESRREIIRALETLDTKVEGRPSKKHGNIPL
ncbi:acetyl-CoA carboxylase, carboxyltransferase component (subunits alpha and beta) [Mesotoga prima MesG1.Ag.4.2]|uniref:Acetyl-CoA carboxylase, carboxyltransferase component (Subunits alpha and beta) n=1 Tax=Mesotoga prima MesG1.Ag.4.2 TaxID=660470 RepID=I2F5H7_9BACT|nr:carboxyl transferase domain-containing protein [Mesotoga prima]AFK07180.1 acetyl-CoA carboxylase, carboxyltransferase component (subunits alpha and beta) [Mesotoga prima MesG1.Ag.4.2]